MTWRRTYLRNYGKLFPRVSQPLILHKTLSTVDYFKMWLPEVISHNLCSWLHRYDPPHHVTFKHREKIPSVSRCSNIPNAAAYVIHSAYLGIIRSQCTCQLTDNLISLNRFIYITNAYILPNIYITDFILKAESRNILQKFIFYCFQLLQSR